MAGKPYVVAGGQDKGTVIVFEPAGIGDLLDEDGHKPNGMGGGAGATFRRTDRVGDMVLEVGARSVLAVPARWELDLDANPVGTGAFGEFIALRDGRLIVAEAMEVESLLRGIGAHHASTGRASDHTETLGELLNIGFGATMQVVDGPV
jgi:hypothetical protein